MIIPGSHESSKLSQLLGFRKHALLTAVVRCLSGLLSGSLVARASLPSLGALASFARLSRLDLLPALLEVGLDLEDVRDGLRQERVDLRLDVRIDLVVILLEVDLGDARVDLLDEVAEALLGGHGGLGILLGGLLSLLGAGGAPLDGLALLLLSWRRLGDFSALGLQDLALGIDGLGESVQLGLEFSGHLGLVMLLEEVLDSLGNLGVDLGRQHGCRVFSLLGLESLVEGVDDSG